MSGGAVNIQYQMGIILFRRLLNFWADNAGILIRGVGGTIRATIDFSRTVDIHRYSPSHLGQNIDIRA